MSAENSRTFSLDKQLLEDLVSSDITVRTDAFNQLPDALSRDEVSDIGVQVSLLPGAEAVREGEKLEKEVIFILGSFALVAHGDLVTATNAAKELRSRGDVLGWLALTNSARKAKKQIVNAIQGLDSEIN